MSEADARKAMELADQVEKDCPGIKGVGMPVPDLITMVIGAAGSQVASLDKNVNAAGGLDLPSAVALMVLGAQASIMQGQATDDMRRQLFEAGYTVGTFMHEHLAAVLVKRQLGVH